MISVENVAKRKIEEHDVIKGPVRTYDWQIIPFFVVTTAVALIGGPLYLYYQGMSLTLFAWTFFYMVATGLSITVGYHRLFTHVTYKATSVVRFLLLLFGAAAFEESAYRWASQHREHHKNVDTDTDPYSIKKGFFYAHMGWMMFWEHEIPYGNVKDLKKQKMVMAQHNNYFLWSFGAGVFMPLLIGLATGHLVGFFIFAICVRLTFVYHMTFFINSICHMFGKATYDIDATAKDNWFIAFLTYGEGYHNFHHRFPSDYRNAVCWYQWDPSKWMIYLLSLFNFTWDLKRVPQMAIQNARLKAEKALLVRREKSLRD